MIMFQLIITIASFVLGLFFKKKISEEKQLKKENKLYEEQWKLQQEIISRNVINDNINDPRVQFKKNRDKYKASK